MSASISSRLLEWSHLHIVVLPDFGTEVSAFREIDFLVLWPFFNSDFMLKFLGREKNLAGREERNFK